MASKRKQAEIDAPSCKTLEQCMFRVVKQDPTALVKAEPEESQSSKTVTSSLAASSAPEHPTAELPTGPSTTEPSDGEEIPARQPEPMAKAQQIAKAPKDRASQLPADFQQRSAAYNKFAYNLKQCSSKVQAVWKKKGAMGEDQLQEFMSTIAKTKRGQVPEEWLRTFEKVVDIKESGEEGGWEPWRQVAAKTGEEELKAMLKSGTVTSLVSLAQFLAIMGSCDVRCAICDSNLVKKNRCDSKQLL